MPTKGIPAKNLKGITSIANPRDFKNAEGVVRYSPAPRSGGGPAVRRAGHRLGDVDEPVAMRMKPTVPTGGGPAIERKGHRLGQVRSVNPQKRMNPLAG